MSSSTNSRRQFIKQTGKASIAMASLPLINTFGLIQPNQEINYQQLPLPYAYNALEPFIDAMTMEIHHTKHAAGYTKNLNDACVAENVDIKTKSITSLLASISKYSTKMRNNAGGHYNHELFWQTMQPAPSSTPTGSLAKMIDASFGSFANFQKAFSDAAKNRFGSGWAWLIVDEKNNLAICTTPNQDNPLMDLADTKGYPLLGLDVWEHAYYLKYQNKRADYINNWWNLVNWKFVEERFYSIVN
ncbi:MAG: superoxide dismutase [Sediminibacterium sp.]|nr:superoxide dismutase [Sediminibacterium sp.]MBP6144294.1 superoxide dismutase [Sediminibacterium sp.]